MAAIQPTTEMTEMSFLGGVLLIAVLLFFALRGRKDITRAKLGGRNKTLDKERETK